VAKEATKAREQASRLRGGPDAVIATEDVKRPTITLKTGAVVDARQAVATVEQLRALHSVDPDEFQTLLALGEGRAGDANPEHFHELWLSYLLEKDERTIQPIVRDVLLNCYLPDTLEGPVVGPLRLQSAADLPVAERAQEQLEEQRRRDLFGDGGQDTGWSKG
jgi:hypothetical protein